jgi:RimJ/RimL family protein N-acetyltransferase
MLTFEYATAAHEKLLLDWANDPETRKNSYSTDEIQWENHIKWFHKKLNDSTCKIYIFKLENDFCGMARIEKSGDEAIIGISVAASHRGKGLSSQIIERASKDYIEQTKVKRVIAYIKADNKPSQRAFEKAGYKELLEMEMHGALSKKYFYGF